MSQEMSSFALTIGNCVLLDQTRSQPRQLIHASPGSDCDQPLFSSRILLSHSQGGNQLKVCANLQSVQVILVSSFFGGIIHFFRPIVAANSRKDFELAFFIQLQEARRQTQRRANRILYNASLPLEIDFLAKSLSIVVPKQEEDLESLSIVFAMGDIQIQSEPTPFSDLEGQELHTVPENRRHLLYAHHQLTLSHTQIFLSNALNEQGLSLPNLSLLDPLSVSIRVGLCRITHKELPKAQFQLSSQSAAFHLTTKSISSIRLVFDSFMRGLDHSMPHESRHLLLVEVLKSLQEAEAAKQKKKTRTFEDPESQLMIQGTCDFKKITLSFSDDLSPLKESKVALNLAIYHTKVAYSSSDKTTEIRMSLNGALMTATLGDELPKVLFDSEGIETNGDSPISISSPNSLVSFDIVSHRWAPGRANHEMTFKLRQIVLQPFLQHIKETSHAINRSMENFVQRGGSISSIKDMVETSTEFAASVMDSLERGQHPVPFLNLSLECEEVAIVFPLSSSGRSLELSVKGVTSNLIISSAMNHYELKGNVGMLSANLPLLSNEAFFPHQVLIQSSASPIWCFIMEYQVDSSGFKVRVQIDEPTLIIPLESVSLCLAADSIQLSHTKVMGNAVSDVRFRSIQIALKGTDSNNCLLNPVDIDFVRSAPFPSCFLTCF